MIEFLDGPAVGQTLLLRRAPLYLRVAFNPRKRSDQWDALDQLTDRPKRHEWIYAYHRAGKPSFLHRKAHSGVWAVAKYEFVEPQPAAESTLWNKVDWQSWCRAQLMLPLAADSHPERGDFVAAILAEPKDSPDDTSRLAFADWLDEHGDADYAEFIRVQCQLCPSPDGHFHNCGNATECPSCWAVRMGGREAESPCTCDPRLRALRTREAELLNHEYDLPLGYKASRPRPRWVGWNPEPGDVRANTCWTFQRGFLHWLRIRWEDWVEHNAMLRARHPIREVQLATMPVLASLSKKPLAEQLSLTFGGIQFAGPGLPRRS